MNDNSIYASISLVDRGNSLYKTERGFRKLQNTTNQNNTAYKNLQKTMSATSEVFGTIAKSALGFSAFAIGLSYGMSKFSQETIEGINNLYKFNTLTGISTNALQDFSNKRAFSGFSVGAKQSMQEIDKLQQRIWLLRNGLGGDAQPFQRLGVDYGDERNIMDIVADLEKIAKTTNNPDDIMWLKQLFSPELIASMRTAENVMTKIGGQKMLGEEQKKNVAEYGQSVDAVSQNLRMLKDQIVATMAPDLTHINENFLVWLSSNSDDILKTSKDLAHALSMIADDVQFVATAFGKLYNEVDKFVPMAEVFKYAIEAWLIYKTTQGIIGLASAFKNLATAIGGATTASNAFKGAGANAFDVGGGARGANAAKFATNAGKTTGMLGKIGGIAAGATSFIPGSLQTKLLIAAGAATIYGLKKAKDYTVNKALDEASATGDYNVLKNSTLAGALKDGRFNSDPKFIKYIHERYDKEKGKEGVSQWIKSYGVDENAVMNRKNPKTSSEYVATDMTQAVERNVSNVNQTNTYSVTNYNDIKVENSGENTTAADIANAINEKTEDEFLHPKSNSTMPKRL